jgi:hypothetical protein
MLVWILGALGLTGGGIGIAALLGGGPAMLLAAKWLLGWLKHATFLQVACVALAIALAVDHGALLVSHHETASWKKQFNAEHGARKADQDAYRKAQADAQALNQAQVSKAKLHQQEISNAIVARLNDDIARLRRELSQGGASAPQSHPVRPAAGNPGGPSAATPGEAGLCLSPEELLRAAENEERHDRLIDWVEEQSKLDPNK